MVLLSPRQDGRIGVIMSEQAESSIRDARLQYPHESSEKRLLSYEGEARSLRKFSSEMLLAQIARFARREGALQASHKGGGPRFRRSAMRKAYEVMNGEVGRDKLTDKYTFTEMVREMRYSAPASVLVSPGANEDSLARQVRELDANDQRRFCKPRDGVKGKGISVATDPNTAITFALSNSKNREYLIQAYEIPVQDWRYILHRDVNQVMQREDPRWRIAYEKVRPTVVGDGELTISQLVHASNEIPRYAKLKYRTHTQRKMRRVVPGEGEQVDVIDSGNISKGGYGRLPEPHELENMDRFMLQFLHDLEEKIGGKLPTACVDIGIKDPSVLQQEYDFEEMKKAVVFYEFQVPFGYEGYVRAAAGQQEGLKRLLPKTLFMTTLNWNLGKSLLISGSPRVAKAHQETVQKEES